MNHRNLKPCLFFIVILFCFSCTPYKNVPYFQDLKQDSVLKEKIKNFTPMLIQPGDLLAIHVTSLDHDADAQFNYNLVRPNGNIDNTKSTDAVDQNAVVGYMVDQDGNINLPSIGLVNVANQSTKDCSLILQNKLSVLLSQPNVVVKIQNFKISVMGDVKAPGVFNVTNERITILEALSLSGDLNTTGLRKNVLLVREAEGNRMYIHLDLTSKNIFESPYYYLRNNDVIYVTPSKERVNNDGTAFQKTTIVLTVLSILAIIFAKNL